MQIIPHHHYRETSSTQKIALKQTPMQQLDQWHLYTADFQTDGIGRNKGSQWVAPSGCCILATYSKVFSNPAPPLSPSLALIAALAMVKTLAQHNITATMKWPNDVLVGGCKIAGVLPDAQQIVMKNNTLHQSLLLGIGLNVNINKAACQSIGARSISMQAVMGNKYDLGAIQTVLNEVLLPYIDRFLTKGIDSFMPLLNDALERYEDAEIVFAPTGQAASPDCFKAKIGGIDERGALLLQHGGHLSAHTHGKIIGAQ